MKNKLVAAMLAFGLVATTVAAPVGTMANVQAAEDLSKKDKKEEKTTKVNDINLAVEVVDKDGNCPIVEVKKGSAFYTTYDETSKKTTNVETDKADFTTYANVKAGTNFRFTAPEKFDVKEKDENGKETKKVLASYEFVGWKVSDQKNVVDETFAKWLGEAGLRINPADNMLKGVTNALTFVVPDGYKFGNTDMFTAVYKDVTKENPTEDKKLSGVEVKENKIVIPYEVKASEDAFHLGISLKENTEKKTIKDLVTAGTLVIKKDGDDCKDEVKFNPQDANDAFVTKEICDPGKKVTIRVQLKDSLADFQEITVERKAKETKPVEQKTQAVYVKLTEGKVALKQDGKVVEGVKTNNGLTKYVLKADKDGKYTLKMSFEAPMYKKLVLVKTEKIGSSQDFKVTEPTSDDGFTYDVDLVGLKLTETEEMIITPVFDDKKVESLHFDSVSKKVVVGESFDAQAMLNTAKEAKFAVEEGNGIVEIKNGKVTAKKAGFAIVKATVDGKEARLVVVSNKKTGWVKEDGKWYLINKEGKKITGWHYGAKKWWFFNEDGSMKSNEWMKENGKWYLFSKSGAMVTGWHHGGGKWYLFDKSGAMESNVWKASKGKWYLLKKDGSMATGKHYGAGKTWYFDKNGAWINK